MDFVFSSWLCFQSCQCTYKPAGWVLLITVASSSALMVGFGCWGTPQAQSDLTHGLSHLESPLLPSSFPPHPTETWPGMIFFLKWEQNLIKSILQVVLPPFPSYLWLWWVLVLGGLQRGCTKRKGAGAGEQSHPQGTSIPSGPPKPPCTGSEPAPRFGIFPGGSCPHRPQPHRSVLSCEKTCFGNFFFYLFFLILLICVCFLQGKKKKRKRDKQPGETNGK